MPWFIIIIIWILHTVCYVPIFRIRWEIVYDNSIYITEHHITCFLRSSSIFCCFQAASCSFCRSLLCNSFLSVSPAVRSLPLGVLLAAGTSTISSSTVTDTARWCDFSWRHISRSFFFSARSSVTSINLRKVQCQLQCRVVESSRACDGVLKYP